jgi:hypothetical protein
MAANGSQFGYSLCHIGKDIKLLKTLASDVNSDVAGGAGYDAHWLSNLRLNLGRYNVASPDASVRNQFFSS